MNLSSLFSKLGLSITVTQDITLLLVLVFASFLLGMFIGRYRLITILINIYVSFAIISVVPEKYFTDYNYKMMGFLALVIVFTLLGKKLFDIYMSGSGTGFLWRVFAMSFLEIVLIISIILSIIPKKVALEYVSPSSYGYLASETALFIWMIIPLILLIFIHKRINR
ncbi:MAG TPA: hypothetical protein PLK35_03205 [Candidatus Moranbacteria bacterium]|nr:hypothetical protein [Candidatus Moranbacteria bacterium]